MNSIDASDPLLLIAAVSLVGAVLTAAIPFVASRAGQNSCGLWILPLIFVALAAGLSLAAIIR